MYKKNEFTNNYTKIWLNEVYLEKEKSYPNNLNLLVFARQYDNAIDGICPDFVFVAYVNLFDKGHFLPFSRKGTKGMIDTLTGTFYPNANTSGSFTIEYTLQDGVTNWEPYT